MKKPENISLINIALEAKLSITAVQRYYRMDGQNTSTETENRIAQAVQKLEGKEILSVSTLKYIVTKIKT